MENPIYMFWFNSKVGFSSTIHDILTLHTHRHQPNSIQNIQGAKSSFDVKKYIKKGGHYVDWGEFQRDSKPGYRGMKDANKAYAEALNTGNT